MSEGYEFGLLLAGAGLPALALLLALSSAWERGEMLRSRLDAAALWALCGLAVFLACAAVVGSAETMNLRNVVRAQANTDLYLLTQPAAAAIYIVSLVLASHESALEPVFGRRGIRRTLWVVLLAVAASLLGAIVFLGGGSGPLAPAQIWVVLKSAGLVAVVALARRAFSQVRTGPRLAIAWGACFVGLLNLAITVLRASL